MSTMTTKHGLIKPELSDPADITQFNENWDKIDEKLSNILITSDVPSDAEMWIDPNEENEVINLETLGAAPAGYGLGGQCRWSLNDLNYATESGFWAWQSTTANTPFEYGSMLVLNRNNERATQIGIDPYMVGNGAIAVRHQYSGGWLDWAYLNPPRTMGVEYRTIERFNGKQVYVKAVSFASLPSSGSTGVAFGTGLNVISIEGVAYDSKYVCPLGNCDKIGEVWYQVSDGKMYISVTGSSNYKAYVVVKYTKE